MEENFEQLKKRFAELGSRAAGRGRYEFSDFLSLAEQDVLLSMRPLPDAFAGLDGGYGAAERKVAVFGGEDVCGYVQSPPVTCVKIAPVSAKFAETLTHRDFLGALMGLGIKREVLGDIAVHGGAAYLFCLDTIADYIADNLTQVRRTTVSAKRVDTPEIVTAEPEETELNIASERLDAIVAAVWKLSRSKAAELIGNELVFIGGRSARSASAVMRDGDIISVRGYGRFVYCGIVKETRKGRLRVRVKIY